MDNLYIVGGAFTGLVFVYIAVRIAGKAWYRSRREHLQEVSRLFGKRTTRIPLKQFDESGDNNGH